MRRGTFWAAVDRPEATQEIGEILRTYSDSQRRAHGRVHRIASAYPVPESVSVRRIDAEFSDFFEVRGDGDEVLGDGAFRLDAALGKAAEQPGSACSRIGESLQSGESLRDDDEQRRLRIDAAKLLPRVGGVDVGDEAALQPVFDIRLERLIGHDRTEVRAADANVHDSADRLAAGPRPLA